MAEKTLEDLFHETLRDIYYAEKKIVKALRKQARAAHNPQLQAAFEKHEEQTEKHVERLEKVFDIIDKRARGKTCEAIEGIISEAEEVMETFKGSPALDAGLLAAAQAVEHYEISRYGTLRAWAEKLGYDDAVSLIDKTLSEESETDDLLTRIAETSVNAAAEKKAA